ncbi:hypothetical protein [Rhodanobacter sp. DHB23]|uniref:helix-turn-helix transcriptional regulator n=1 Tax=Rhodanobacter sp. DHB23 TaxID=2775923 RepID=UPI00177EC57A|nr:hypothetical protein [Rhodanobacter sp. DHB23]MBD8874020.1 hypothetical protein [Rhodanobacter sp. DHB23]
MISMDAFSELLQILYSAPLQQEQWQRFLGLVSNYTRSSTGFFISTDDRLQPAVLAEGGQSQGKLVSTYNQAYAQSDPFRGAIIRYARTRNPVGVYTEDDLLPDDGLLQTPIYRDLLVPANLRHAAITILALSVRCLDAISLWRTPDEGPVDAGSRGLLELLIPHVQIALEVNRRIRASEQGLAGAEVMADACPTATFVLTADGTIRQCNAAAESLLRAGDGLRSKHGQLAADDLHAERALEKLLSDVGTSFLPPGREPCCVLSMQRGSGKRPLQLIATPLPDDRRQRTGGEVLLLATDPVAPAHFYDDLLRALYDFTPAEIEVANGLLMGYSAQEIACLRRVAIGTVRQQIKSMLAKTGTCRQSDMVRLFMTLPRTTVPISS